MPPYQNQPYQQASIQPAGHSPEWYRARKHFLIVLFTWLPVLPAVALLQIIVNVILSASADTGPSQIANIIAITIRIVAILGGMYGIFGWIPTLILGIIWAGKK